MSTFKVLVHYLTHDQYDTASCAVIIDTVSFNPSKGIICESGHFFYYFASSRFIKLEKQHMLYTVAAFNYSERHHWPCHIRNEHRLHSVTAQLRTCCLPSFRRCLYTTVPYNMLLHKAPIARPSGEDLEENEPRFEGILPNVYVDY